jgi:RNA polymerase sigma-70 factor (ECF subfamily)
MTDDEQLMMQAGEGDMDAFEELVIRHQQSALNVAYRFLGERALAEDAVQEAFLKLLASAGRYRPTARFRTFLYSVLWHVCVDFHRKKHPGPLDTAPAPEDPAPGPAQAALDGERADLVRQAVQELPARQRMALVLKHFDGMSYEEIAQMLECSPTAVDALLVRARRRLQERLKGLL